MDIHNLTAKERKKIHTWLRALIQLLYFIFIPSVYTAAFAGVKYIFTQIGAGEKVVMTSFVTVLRGHLTRKRMSNPAMTCLRTWASREKPHSMAITVP